MSSNLCKNRITSNTEQPTSVNPSFGLVGEKLGHSFSPQIHRLLGDYVGSYDYKLYEIPKNQIEDFVKNTDLKGFNVTIPYKEVLLPYCDRLSDAAKTIGCVNTVVRQADGTLFGDNTDYYGFNYLLKKSGIDCTGKKALILGSGGASKTVNAVLKDSGAGEVITISRSGRDNYSNISSHYDAAIIVNTTPVGMFPNNGKSPLDLTPFKSCIFAADLIYNPAKTAFLLQAEELGIPCSNGLSMLTAQAKAASEIFTGNKIPDEAIMRITCTIESASKNIVLIGMPGCGKTTAGKKLAKQLNRQFIDIDEEIVKKEGCSIPHIFSEKGEEYFRNLETETVSEFCKKSGLVIASGGGVVTKERNKPLLHQNSIVVLLERPINELSTDGRPVSQSRNIMDIYKERQPLYLTWSHLKVNNASELYEIFRDNPLNFK